MSIFCTHHVNDENKYGRIKSTQQKMIGHRIPHFLRDIMYVYLMYLQAVKIIMSLSSVRLCLYSLSHVDDENKCNRIRTTEVEYDFSMFKGGLT